MAERKGGLRICESTAKGIRGVVQMALEGPTKRVPSTTATILKEWARTDAFLHSIGMPFEGRVARGGKQP